MQINKKTLNSIAKKLNIVSAAGRATLEQMLIGAPAGYNEESLTDYLVDQYKALIESCASSAASLGATEYNKYREQQTGDISFQATPENQYDPEITEDIVRNQIAAACDKKDLGLLAESLGKNIDASVMHAYSGTHYKNAKRDPLKPRYARVPTSPTPCKFCLMLASQGFVYLSKETAGEYNKYHPFCRCQAVPQFDKAGREIEIEGYDPKKLYEQYKNGDFGFNSKSTKTKTPRVSAKMPKIEKPILSTTPSAAPLPAKVYGGEWNQVEDMQKFISNVFDPDDYVGVCGEFWDSNGRLVPTRGLYQRTASRINDVLNNTHNVSAAVGRYKRATGAYVRINPLDGKGVSDINVKSLKYTLIECDTGSLEQQYGFIKALNLPTKAVVTSGKKSVHALVRIDAKDLDEYKQRVALLHAECKAAGFNVDTSTKNPSRYMRIPGVKRGDGRQVLVSLNEGAKSWDDWVKWADDARLQANIKNQTVERNIYKDVTDSWYKKANPSNKSVEYLKEVTIEGKTYKVGQKGVSLEVLENEKRVGDLLLNTFGGRLEYYPEIRQPEHIKTPDYLFNSVRTDLKTLESNKEDALFNACHKKKGQATDFIFDISQTEISREEAERQAINLFKRRGTKFVERVMLVDGDDIFKIFER